MATAVLSRWARRFLLVGVAFLLLSQLGALATPVVHAADVASLGLVPVTAPSVEPAGHPAIALAAAGIEYSLAGTIWTRSSGG